MDPSCIFSTLTNNLIIFTCNPNISSIWNNI
jgi:hypothetical protein